jgi:MerR family copper efflux transcriptional regulator
MRIGELARRAGVSQAAIRFYEKSGLLPPPSRTGSGYRAYDETALQGLLAIQLGQKLGLSLQGIRAALPATAAGRPAHELILETLNRQVAEIERRQRELAAQRTQALALRTRLETAWSAGACLSMQDLAAALLAD